MKYFISVFSKRKTVLTGSSFFPLTKNSGKIAFQQSSVTAFSLLMNSSQLLPKIKADLTFPILVNPLS